ncbi:MAG: folate family ECF transporter S component [Oscillospiraceae bacterium]|nr:folate family ECF transporter S component [Oscillospiraceae bacterium]
MSKIKRLAIDGMFAALYFVLTMLSIRMGQLRITFGSLPIVLCALLLGPGDAVAVAAVGEFFNQLLSYGLMPTTPLWIIPPVLRGLAIGLVMLRFRRSARPLERRPVPYYLTCIGAALVTTIANTAVLYLDAVIYGYYTFAYVFGAAAIRTVTGIVTAFLVATLAAPLATILKKHAPHN